MAGKQCFVGAVAGSMCDENNVGKLGEFSQNTEVLWKRVDQ